MFYREIPLNNKFYTIIPTFFYLALMFGALSLFLCSCHSHESGEKLDPVRLLVVDSEISDQIKSNTREIKGWWFGARDVYRNPNVGEIFSDIFARNLAKNPSLFEVYPRTDFRYYSASKKDRLEKSFPQLGDNAINQLFSGISPCDFARDLNLQKVIVAKINNCYTTHNRTIHWWSSVVDVDVEILDAETCQPEWSANIRKRKNFAEVTAPWKKW